MLIIEKLVCENEKFHKNCTWQKVGKPFDNKDFHTLRVKLSVLTRDTKQAHRIVHKNHGVLITIKMGHDNRIFTSMDKNAIRYIHVPTKIFRISKTSPESKTFQISKKT